ncbi:metal-dependent hydrolase [Aquimarina sp. I32.4]|uniref:metal-dependent hydrolase n=1 Tax=Aquimarina sp. I32.4 TaxID=2053903 RepID=UPI000CDEED72|nr:metal-dependent hydrolase [Aquimarina sp. I32.4]
MDSLTQIVLGAAMGEAALGKKVGNKAMLWGAVAGTIPDLDVLSNFFVDPITANELHRGFSHSIIFCIIAAPILGWMIAKIYKNKEADWKDWSWLMFLGLFTHPILDAFTTWGTQLFWPFDYKVSFKNIFVIDPLYTIPFLVFVIIAMFYNRTHPKRKLFNNLGILISSLYMIITLVLQRYAWFTFWTNLENQHITYQEIQTRPTPLNSILWSANIETKDSFLIGYYSLFDKDDYIDFSEFPKNHHFLGAMKNDPLITRLIKLSEGWYTIEKHDDHLFFNDLRFGQLEIDSESKKFAFSYELFYDKDGILVAKERERKMGEASPLLQKLFHRILGNKS